MISKMLKKNEKGFTLMEMLIVVAIIAVLIAIAIPTFNSSLNKAKIATDEANIRSGYASAMVQVLAGDVAEPNANDVFYLLKDGTIAAADNGKAPTNAYQCQGTPGAAVDIAGQNVTAWAKDNYITYTYKVTTGTGANNTSTSTFTFEIGHSAT